MRHVRPTNMVRNDVSIVSEDEMRTGPDQTNKKRSETKRGMKEKRLIPKGNKSQEESIETTEE